QWRADWESRNTSHYLDHYSRKFSSGKQDYKSWAKQKQSVNASKDWIKVGLTNVSMFRSPGKDDLVVVTFDQTYRSNNLANTMKKRQYWINEGGNWRIVYEGAA